MCIRDVNRMVLVVAMLTPATWAIADDQPQWGERFSRNMVSDETGLPETFEPGHRDPATGVVDMSTAKNVKWMAPLGNISYGTPVVADGRVYVGTNNGVPRDPRITGDRGVLLCLDEATGTMQWQLVLPKMTWIKWSDWRGVGITSSPAVEGDRLYLVSNRAEVMCLDVQGMKNGNDGPFTDEGRLMAPKDHPPLQPGERDADVVWLFDMPAEVKSEPHNAANCSVLVHGDLLYVCTANGVEWTHNFVVHPEAPSVIVLDKRTGKLIARDDFGIGPDLTHGQWSSLATATIGGRQLGFFGAGNGYLYAFEMLVPDDLKKNNKNEKNQKPLKLKNVWKFHGHPEAQTRDDVKPDHQHDSTSYQVTAMPVVHDDRVYLTFTQEPYHRMRQGWLVCLDAKGKGDITKTGLIWSYDAIGSSTSTVAISDGRVHAAGFDGRLHCLDAKTGNVHWIHEVGAPCAASPFVADGKIYLGTDRQTFWTLQSSDKPNVLGTMRLRGKISATATAANGTLYVTSWRRLYAIAKDEAK